MQKRYNLSQEGQVVFPLNEHSVYTDFSGLFSEGFRVTWRRPPIKSVITEILIMLEVNGTQKTMPKFHVNFVYNNISDMIVIDC